MEKVAVIILNYNSFTQTNQCVCEIRKQKYVNIELIIVDNKSTADSEITDLQQLAQNSYAILLEADKNRGYNAGNNIGIRYALDHNINYILIANPDMLFPDTEYIYKLLNSIIKFPQIAVVGSDIITPEGFHQNPIAFKLSSVDITIGWITNILKKRNHKSDNWNDRYNETRECSILNGCCFLIKADFLKRINLFDERIFLFGEERILGAQVIQNNFRMLYNGKTHAIHNHIQSKEGKQWPRLKMLKNSELLFIRLYANLNTFQRVIAIACIHAKYLFLHLKYYRK